MKKQINQLNEFQRAFLDETEQTPVVPDEKLANLRFKLLKEENEEFLKACQDKNIIECADALGDCLYIILGSIYKCGMNNVIEEVFDRIHASNMSKLDVDGKPIVNGQNGVYDADKPVGKFLKSVNYKKVDLRDLF